MTFDDDMIQLEWPAGQVQRFWCANHCISWPPPEEIQFFGFTWVREKMSQITDDQRKDMTHVCRGAVYKVKKQ